MNPTKNGNEFSFLSIRFTDFHGYSQIKLPYFFYFGILNYWYDLIICIYPVSKIKKMFNILFNIIVIAKKNTSIYKVLSLDTTILSG